MDGVSWSGSPAGSTTTNGIPRARSCSRIDLAQVGEDGDDAHRPPREGALDPALAGPPATLHLGQDDGELMPPGDPLDAAHDLERPLALELVEDQLEERRPARRPDRPLVAVLADDRLDATARRGRHVGAAVDDLRDGRDGDAGLVGRSRRSSARFGRSGPRLSSSWRRSIAASVESFGQPVRAASRTLPIEG